MRTAWSAAIETYRDDLLFVEVDVRWDVVVFWRRGRVCQREIRRVGLNTSEIGGEFLEILERIQR